MPSESIAAEDHSWQILLVYYNIILSGEWKFEFRRNERRYFSNFYANLIFEVCHSTKITKYSPICGSVNEILSSDNILVTLSMFQGILYNTHEIFVKSFYKCSNTFANNLPVYISGPENHGVVYFRSTRSEKLTDRRILILSHDSWTICNFVRRFDSTNATEKIF